MRSPEMSKDWSRACRLTNRTLASIRNQLNPNWQCVLSCNRAPEGMAHDERITVIEHPHPIPKDRWGIMLDKGEKKRLALEWLKENPSRYAMLVDDDDLVHREMTAFIAAHATECWLIRQGYAWYEGRWPFLVTEDHFDQKCGTCYVLRIDGRYALNGDCSNHMLMSDHSKIRGLTGAASIPFRSAIQCRATGENVMLSKSPLKDAGSMFRLMKRSRPLTGELKTQFAIPG